MIHSLTERLSRLVAGAWARLRRPHRPATARVKGCMKNVIVLKPPDPMFREAVFILRDDYLMGDELNRQELLLQARAAAQSYVDTLVPPRRRSVLIPTLVLVALVLACLRLTGVI